MDTLSIKITVYVANFKNALRLSFNLYPSLFYDYTDKGNISAYK